MHGSGISDEQFGQAIPRDEAIATRRRREALVRMARRNLAHVKAGTVDRAPAVHRVPARRQSVAGPNWKIAYDGYLDFYYLPILHRNSFGPRMPSQALYDAWGPHQRVSMPNPGLAALESLPEEQWDVDALIGGVWTVFLHISIADFAVAGNVYMVSKLFPGLGIQRALETGQTRDVLFGCNEWGGQRFHCFVDALLRTEDAQLRSLLAAGADGGCAS